MTKDTIKWILKMKGKEYSSEIYVGDLMSFTGEEIAKAISKRVEFNVKLTIQDIVGVPRKYND